MKAKIYMCRIDESMSMMMAEVEGKRVIFDSYLNMLKPGELQKLASFIANNMIDYGYDISQYNGKCRELLTDFFFNNLEVTGFDFIVSIDKTVKIKMDEPL